MHKNPSVPPFVEKSNKSNSVFLFSPLDFLLKLFQTFSFTLVFKVEIWHTLTYKSIGQTELWVTPKWYIEIVYSFLPIKPRAKIRNWAYVTLNPISVINFVRSMHWCMNALGGSVWKYMSRKVPKPSLPIYRGKHDQCGSSSETLCHFFVAALLFSSQILNANILLWPFKLKKTYMQKK